MRSLQTNIPKVLKAILFLIFYLATFSVYSQIFSNSGDFGIPQNALIGAAGDMDNDGDYDLVTIGENSTDIFLNSKGTFTLFPTSIPKSYWVINLIDFDNDGDLDIAPGGVDNKAFIYSNNNLTFTLQEFPTEAGNADTYWMDLNNDGVPELLAFNGTNTTIFSYIDGSYVKQSHNIEDFSTWEVKQADFNNDGWTDLLITSTYHIKVLLNQKKDFLFTPITIFEDRNIAYAISDIGDFNNDGYSDVIFSHNTSGNAKTRIFLYNKNNGFDDSNIPNLPQTGGGSVSRLGLIEVADFDGNGLDDFFVSGKASYSTNPTHEAFLYLNKGNSVFEQTDDDMVPVVSGTCSVIDINNDGKSDLFVGGSVETPTTLTPLNKFYVNGNSVPPSPPSLPVGLTYTQVKNRVIIQWPPVQDDHCEHPRYNVKIGTTTMNADIVNTNANGDFPLNYNSSNAADTFKILTISSHTPRTIYASVQAIDNSFVHSAYSTPLAIEILPKSDFSVSKDTICSGEEIQAYFAGFHRGNPTFHWSVNGIGLDTLRDSTARFTFHEPGHKTISLFIEDAGIKSAVKSINVVVKELAKVDFTLSASLCHPDTSVVRYAFAKAKNHSFLWTVAGGTVFRNEGDTTLYIKWTQLGAKQITLKLTNTANGCAIWKTKSFNVVQTYPKPPIPEICIVTTDPRTSRNMIVWSYSSPVVNSFLVYRETHIAGEFLLLKTIASTDEFNSYVDDQSLPSQVANRYKIAAVDTCGVVTDHSVAHKTIHLSISRGQGSSFNLAWNHYEGFNYGTYNIYRGTHAADMALLAQVASNVTSYTDIDPPSEKVVYQIEVIAPHRCEDGITTGRQNRLHTSSVSNIIGMSDIESKTASVFPNPFTEKVTLNQDANGANYIVTDRIGKQVLSGTINDQNEIDLGNLSSGLYVLHIKVKKTWSATKILKKPLTL